MEHHVAYSFHETTVYEGPPQKDGDEGFPTFEAARAAAIKDLQHWIDLATANLKQLQSATSVADLNN